MELRYGHKSSRITVKRRGNLNLGQTCDTWRRRRRRRRRRRGGRRSSSPGRCAEGLPSPPKQCLARIEGTGEKSQNHVGIKCNVIYRMKNIFYIGPSHDFISFKKEQQQLKKRTKKQRNFPM